MHTSSSDFDKFLDSPIDAVTVAVPSGIHGEAAVAAANAKKHILCEKPIEVTIEKTAELIEIPIADWAAVDRLEGYPRLYDRQLFLCTLADETTDTGWIYIMNNLPPMATVIKSGDWKVYHHG